jgi:hypothetical protein
MKRNTEIWVSRIKQQILRLLEVIIVNWKATGDDTHWQEPEL